MSFVSINPYTSQKVFEQSLDDEQILRDKLALAQKSWEVWRNVPVRERSQLIANAGQILLENQETFARTITLEMGKPISESRGEIKKCAWVCNYYARHAKTFLEPEIIPTDATESYVRFDPIGAVLAIMPWNFPFWQVFRFAAPTLTAGNTALLKHAENVPQCALHIADVFKQAGFPDGVFQNLFFGHDKTERIIADDTIKAVSLTGSGKAGKIIAGLAGSHLKKSLLELGGSNAFIVCEDADMKSTVETAINARMMNSGQSCIASKRFILIGNSYEQFMPAFISGIEQLKSGNPLDEDVHIGTLARLDLAEKLEQQIQQSVAKGARIVSGGKRNGTYHEPTILDQVRPGMPAFDEETFGPLAAIIRVNTIEEAIQLSNQSAFGLGVTLCTSDMALAKKCESQIEDGAFFVNELVKSDPRLPFGGTKISGYGRELARDGMLEFVNRKTVYVK